MPMPSKYDPELVERICERVANGETINEVCRDLGVVPRTFRRWCATREDVRKLKDEAMEDGNEAILDDVMEIIDDGRNDWMERKGKNGETETVFNPENVQRSKLRAWGRFEILARRDPVKYGSKQTIDHRGKVSLESLVAGAGKPKASDPE